MTWESLKVLELIGKIASRNTEPAVGSSYHVNEGLGQEIHHYTRRLLGHPSLACGFKEDMLCIDRLVLYIHNCTDNIIIAAIFRDPNATAQSIMRTHIKIKTYEGASAFWKRQDSIVNPWGFLIRYKEFLFDFDWLREKLINEFNQSVGSGAYRETSKMGI